MDKYSFKIYKKDIGKKEESPPPFRVWGLLSEDRRWIVSLK